MLLMRPDAAHRVTVFGSTRKSAATSPGVRRRSLLPSTDLPSHLRFGACLQCRENIRLLPCFPKNEPLVPLVSFGFGRAGRRRGPAAQACPADIAGCTREVAECADPVGRCRAMCNARYGMCRALLSSPGGLSGGPITERVLAIRFTQSPGEWGYGWCRRALERVDRHHRRRISRASPAPSASAGGTPVP